MKKQNIEHIKSAVIIALSIAVVVLVWLYLYHPAATPPPTFINTEPPQTQQLRGFVLKYGNNPSGDVDKLVLQNNNEITELHFPPHTAKQVLSIAPLGARVTVTVNTKQGKKEKANALQIITNAHRTLYIDEIAPPPPAQGNEVTVSGTSVQIKKDEGGKINSFVLSGKLIALPPHEAETIVPLLTGAKKIMVKGSERDTVNGFVNINGLQLLKPSVITIDSISYLVR